MAAISNRDLRISIVTFYNLNRSKGKNYTLKHFSSQIRAKIVSQSQIYRWLEAFEKSGITVRKSGSGCPSKFDKNRVRVNLFKNLKSKVHQANQNGLSSLNKF